MIDETLYPKYRFRSLKNKLLSINYNKNRDKIWQKYCIFIKYINTRGLKLWEILKKKKIY